VREASSAPADSSKLKVADPPAFLEDSKSGDIIDFIGAGGEMDARRVKSIALGALGSEKSLYSVTHRAMHFEVGLSVF